MAVRYIINIITCIIVQLCCIICSYGQSNTDTILISAIKQNDIHLAEKLINQGANINAVDSNLASSLMWAAYSGSLPLFKYLVQKGADYTKKGVIYLDSTKNGYYGNIMGISAGKNDTLLLAYCLDTLKISANDKEYNTDTKEANGWVALGSFRLGSKKW
jgi:ankyrin repeat protein